MPNIKWFTNNGDYFYFWDNAPVHLSGVSLNETTIVLTTAGQTQQLTATAMPTGAVETTGFTWSSSDTSVATVDSNGLVTCVTPGDCTITVTTTVGGFTATCSVTARVEVYADFLLVGGGGAGSRYYGGGGGAGGVIQCCAYHISMGNYPITIGQGGTGCDTRCTGYNGCSSTFDGLTAYGGGGGGGNAINGVDGGSGGGGGFPGGSYYYGGSGCSGQGYNGGNSSGYAGGGGGGAGGNGCNYSSSCRGGMGGIGIQSDISGTLTWYAGGGSGYDGWDAVDIAANCGGTASGRASSSNAKCCGAGGGGTIYGYGESGKGGCGIFILRYPTACGYDLTGGCKYTCGDYTIHCFTSSGTLCVN